MTKAKGLIRNDK